MIKFLFLCKYLDVPQPALKIIALFQLNSPVTKQLQRHIIKKKVDTRIEHHAYHKGGGVGKER